MALTTRWIGMNASSSVHHQCRQRAGSHGPDTVSTAASMAIQRGSSRNWDSTRAQPVGQVEVPLRRGEARAGDRQREDGEQRGRRVGDQQSPLPGEDQADQDHERQRQHREAVDQVDHVGLGRRQHPDDAGDGFLQLVPPGAGDQRAGDHDRQQRPRQRDPQDVVGAPSQGLQQAAGNADFAPVDVHALNDLRTLRPASDQRSADNITGDLRGVAGLPGRCPLRRRSSCGASHSSCTRASATRLMTCGRENGGPHCDTEAAETTHS